MTADPQDLRTVTRRVTLALLLDFDAEVDERETLSETADRFRRGWRVSHEDGDDPEITVDDVEVE